MVGVRLKFAVLATALISASCGRPDSGFDVRRFEASIPAAIVPDDPDAVTNVSCPEMPTSEATTITCTALVADRAVEITAVISTDGAVDLSTGSVLLDLEKVAEEAARRLGVDLGVESIVECPGSVLVSVAGDTFGCTATDPGGVAHKLVISILDGSGNWSIDMSG